MNIFDRSKVESGYPNNTPTSVKVLENIGTDSEYVFVKDYYRGANIPIVYRAIHKNNNSIISSYFLQNVKRAVNRKKTTTISNN